MKDPDLEVPGHAKSIDYAVQDYAIGSRPVVSCTVFSLFPLF
jgi:hypothetical protein